MKYRISAILSLAALGLSAQVAQYSFTLKEAQDFAVENAYDPRIQKLEIEKTRKLIMETASAGLPQVNATGNFQKYLEIPTTLIPAEAFGGPAGEYLPVQFGLEYTAGAQFNVNQLIFDGSYIVALVATKVLKENAELGFERSTIQSRELIAQTYHAILVSERLEGVLQDNIETLRESLEQNRKLLKEGFLEEQDVDQLELLVTDIEINLDYTRRLAKVSRYLLNVQLGIPVESEITLEDDIEKLITLTVDGESLLTEQFDPEQNVEYRSLETNERGALLNIRNEQMSYLPKINGFLTLAQNYQNNDPEFWQDVNSNRWFPNYFIGANVSIPIFTGLRRSARVSQAKIDLDKVEVAKEQLEGNLKVEYQRVKAQFEFNLSNLNTRKRNAEIANKILNNTLIKYREGLASSLELTQTQNQYLDALRQYVNAAQQALDSRAAMERVLGKYNLN